jgi:hypothetical protein
VAGEAVPVDVSCTSGDFSFAVSTAVMDVGPAMVT